MKITHNDKTINLNNNNYLSEGGEGRVYIKNNLLYKIFHKNPIPQQKITELSVLDNSHIMRPIDPIFNNKKYIGFSMRYAPDTVPLCKLFTTTFWSNNNITSKQILKLIKNIKLGIEFIHKNNCLLVDINEFNFLVNQYNFTDPYFIDVDSYQTPNHPATAIMNSIRDWHSSKFSESTDWFSFAVIACQLLIGIHPFKGKHPSYNKKDLKKRMENNISIFNQKTRIPMSTRDFSHIPSEYKLWFIDLFEKGNRSLPPFETGSLVITTKTVKIEKIKRGLIIKLLWESEVKGHADYYSWRGYELCNIYKIIFFPDGRFVMADINYNQLCIYSMDKDCKANIEGKELLLVDNMLFIVNHNKITQIAFVEGDTAIAAALTKSWDILPYAHKVMDGFLYQNILGKAHLSFFYKRNEKTNCSIMAIPELDGYRMVDGKYENRVCVVIGFKNGKYDEFILKFDKKYSKYSCFKTDDVDSQDVNMTVLDKGLVLMLDDGGLRVFTNDLDNDSMRVIEDENLNSGMRLCHKENQAQFIIDNKVYSLKMGG